MGMFRTFAAATVAVYYKSDTRCVFYLCGFQSLRVTYAFSIQAWALVEAKNRMEARSEATDYVALEVS